MVLSKVRHLVIGRFCPQGLGPLNWSYTMKKFLLLAAAAMLLTSSNAMAAGAGTFSSPLSGSVFLNPNGAVTLSVTVSDANIDCGTINYTAATPFPAGSLCPSGDPLATAAAKITGNALKNPFYITLTDVSLGFPNQVVLFNGANSFALDLAITIDGGAYAAGGYYTPGSDTSNILITPTTHSAAAAQPAGRYTGSTTLFISF